MTYRSVAGGMGTGARSGSGASGTSSGGGERSERSWYSSAPSPQDEVALSDADAFRKRGSGFLTSPRAMRVLDVANSRIGLGISDASAAASVVVDDSEGEREGEGTPIWELSLLPLMSDRGAGNAASH